MSSKKGNRVLWESSQLNSQTYMMYRDWILSIAMNRYKWLNLPKSCDERYLEFTLATQGCATICNAGGVWVSTQAATGMPNLYDDPVDWRSVGNNGWSVEADPTTGVVVWDNTLRYPIWRNINLWAQRLAEIDRTVDINLNHQKIPWIFTCDQSKKLDLTNVVKQAMGGEPAILGYKGLEQYKGELLCTPVDFKGNELLDAKKRIWSEIYTFLGIENIDAKSERMIEAEVMSASQPSDLRALDGLRCRRQACEYLNDMFDLNLQVVWNQDNISDNYNTSHNLKQASQYELLGEGETDADISDDLVR